MKKIISLVMTLCLIIGAVSLLASCGEEKTLTMDSSDFGTAAPQTSKESSSETTQSTSETTANTVNTSADTSESEEISLDVAPETTLAEITTDIEVESSEAQNTVDDTTTADPLKWPTEDIYAAVGVGVPDFEGYYDDIYTMESPFTTVEQGISISIYGADMEDVDAYKSILLENGYVLVSGEYHKERTDGTTIVMDIVETIDEFSTGFEFDIRVYKSEGALSAWPAQKITEALGNGTVVPVFTGATSYDIDVVNQDVYGITMSMIAVGCYGADANDIQTYESALVSDGFTQTESEDEESVTYAKMVGNTQIMCMVGAMSTSDGVMIAFVSMPDTQSTHTMPENIKIEYNMLGGSSCVGIKIGDDYLLQDADGDYFFKYDEINNRWSSWTREKGSASWVDDELYCEDVAEVESMVFSFVVDSSTVNLYTDTQTTQNVLGINAKKYTLNYEDTYNLYILQDPETNLILESGIVGAETLSSKVTAIDKTVTGFGIEIPAQ